MFIKLYIQWYDKSNSSSHLNKLLNLNIVDISLIHVLKLKRYYKIILFKYFLADNMLHLCKNRTYNKIEIKL